MNKTEIVDALADRAKLSKRQALQIVGIIFDEIIRHELAEGRDVRIARFATFRPRDRRAMRGRHPRTGKPIRIAARRWAQLRASKALVDAMNPVVEHVPMRKRA
jgi:DNA-binding protein HU-beta